MDSTVLVKSDLATEAQILGAIERANTLPITFCEWYYDEEAREWRLIIASPWVDTKGPRIAYQTLIKALQNAKAYDRVQLQRVYIKSPDDSLVKHLQKEAPTEGFLHLVRYSDGNYAAIFAPITRDGAVPSRHFSSLDELTAFLEDEVHLSRSSLESALDDMKRSGTGSVYPVVLKSGRLKKLGFL